MIIRIMASMLAIAIGTQAVQAAEPPLDAKTLPDAELGRIRGKFLLPNGIEVAMTVQTDTSIDGQLLLRSVFTVDRGPSTLSIYSPANTSTPQAQPGTSSGGAGSTSPGVSVSFDRESGMTMVRPDYATNSASVNVGTGSGEAIGKSPDGSAPLMLAPDGTPVVTANGQVSLDRLPAGTRVTLTRPDFEVSHVVGQAYGSILANTASDRTIDTSTTINLDLANATPALVGSSMPRIEGLALDVSKELVR